MKRFPLILLLCISLATKAGDNNDRAMYSYSQSVDIFSSVIKNLSTHYVDTINLDEIVQLGIDAMLYQLDPYTNYFDEEEASEFTAHNSGEYAGIGCLIMNRDSAVYISEVIENTPAQQTGLRAGDKFVIINNDIVLGWSSDKVSSHLRGIPNSALTLEIERPGADSLLHFDINRQLIQQSSVPYYCCLSDSIGYIQLESFSEKSYDETRTALLDLMENNPIEGLILDLRGNGGGLVQNAINILGMFLPRGTTVLKSKGRDEIENVYVTPLDPIAPNLPLVVLIDGNSASASEVTAGALQDLDRAVIMGERSFGKGLIQSTYPLPFNGIIKITTNYYYTPSGRSIQAIDYKNRDKQGEARRIPDSLTNEFTTSLGRIVRDGGGITPDIAIAPDTMSHLCFALWNNHCFFDFATQYVLQHDSITDIANFYLTDKDYQAFKDFVVNKDIKYDRYTSRSLNYLREAMKFEGYLNDSTQLLLEQLSQSLTHNISSELDFFRKEIEKELTMEIVKHYQYQRASIIVAIRDDKTIEKALEILHTPKQYAQILSPTQQ